jgi:hypothetical protein
LLRGGEGRIVQRMRGDRIIQRGERMRESTTAELHDESWRSGSERSGIERHGIERNFNLSQTKPN